MYCDEYDFLWRERSLVENLRIPQYSRIHREIHSRNHIFERILNFTLASQMSAWELINSFVIRLHCNIWRYRCYVQMLYAFSLFLLKNVSLFNKSKEKLIKQITKSWFLDICCSLLYLLYNFHCVLWKICFVPYILCIILSNNGKLQVLYLAIQRDLRCTINNIPRFSELTISLHLPDSNLSLYVIREAFDEIYTIVNLHFLRNAINSVKIHFEFPGTFVK